MAIPYRPTFFTVLRAMFPGPKLPVRRASDTLNRRRLWTTRESILLRLGGTFGRNTRPGEAWTCLQCGRANNSGPRCTKCGEARTESAVAP